MLPDAVHLKKKKTNTDLFSRDKWLVGFCFTSTETVGLLGTGAQDVHLDFHTAPELSWAHVMMMS